MLKLFPEYKIAFVDEVGRGPIAGPTTAAAVLLDEDAQHWLFTQGVGDSKKFHTKTQKQTLYKLAKLIIAVAVDVKIVHVSATEIDRIGINAAIAKAMRLAVKNLRIQPDEVWIDGDFEVWGSGIPQMSIVDGDDKILGIGAASMVAKASRDGIMRRLAKQFPHYGWESNAGYGGNVAHQAGLKQFGIVPGVHRMSFKGMQQYQGCVAPRFVDQKTLVA